MAAHPMTDDICFFLIFVPFDHFHPFGDAYLDH